jgi:hypothetical protein
MRVVAGWIIFLAPFVAGLVVAAHRDPRALLLTVGSLIVVAVWLFACFYLWTGGKS